MFRQIHLGDFSGKFYLDTVLLYWDWYPSNMGRSIALVLMVFSKDKLHCTDLAGQLLTEFCNFFKVSANILTLHLKFFRLYYKSSTYSKLYN